MGSVISAGPPAPADNARVIRLSELLRRPIADRGGESLGRITDVIVWLRGADYPPAIGLVAEVNGRKVFIPIAQAAPFDGAVLNWPARRWTCGTSSGATVQTVADSTPDTAIDSRIVSRIRMLFLVRPDSGSTLGMSLRTPAARTSTAVTDLLRRFGVFLCGPVRLRATRPGRARWHRGMAARRMRAFERSHLTGVVMGVIAWIVLGIIAGAIAEHLISRRESHGVIITCLIGVAGALLGGWLATELFHVHSLQGFFNLSTWITALAGSTALLGAVHLVEGQRGGRRSLRR